MEHSNEWARKQAKVKQAKAKVKRAKKKSEDWRQILRDINMEKRAKRLKQAKERRAKMYERAKVRNEPKEKRRAERDMMAECSAKMQKDLAERKAKVYAEEMGWNTVTPIMKFPEEKAKKRTVHHFMPTGHTQLLYQQENAAMKDMEKMHHYATKHARRMTLDKLTKDMENLRKDMAEFLEILKATI